MNSKTRTPSEVGVPEPVVEDATRTSAKVRLGGREAFLFSLRAAVAGATAFACYRWTHLPGQSWAPISAVLVMEPTLRPSLRLSLLRFAGNLAGAVCGAGASVLIGQNSLAIIVGLIFTGTVCHYARLDEGRRPAYVAMLIVLLTSSATGGVLNSSLDRLVAVVIGCVVALLVAFAFESVLKHSTLERGGGDSGE